MPITKNGIYTIHIINFDLPFQKTLYYGRVETLSDYWIKSPEYETYQEAESWCIAKLADLKLTNEPNKKEI